MLSITSWFWNFNTYNFAVKWTSSTVPSGLVSTSEPHRSLGFTRNRLRSHSTDCPSKSIDFAPWISCHFNGLLAQTNQLNNMDMSFFSAGDASCKILSIIREYLQVTKRCSIQKSVTGDSRVINFLWEIIWFQFLIQAIHRGLVQKIMPCQFSQ